MECTFHFIPFLESVFEFLPIGILLHIQIEVLLTFLWLLHGSWWTTGSVTCMSGCVCGRRWRHCRLIYSRGRWWVHLRGHSNMRWGCRLWVCQWGVIMNQNFDLRLVQCKGHLLGSWQARIVGHGTPLIRTWSR